MATQIELTENAPPIQHLCKKDKRLAKVISIVGPITYTVHEDGFDFLVHEIIEQMLSIKAGAKIYERLVKLWNGQITPEQIDSLTDDDIKSIGTSKSKVSYIRTVTNEVLSENLVRDELQDLSNEEVYKKLLALRGIGKWTAKMYLIFVLNRQDILPYEDVAFLQSYEWLYKTKERSKESIEKKCKKWKPYSSIAARYLYKALDTGLTKELFKLYGGNKMPRNEKATHENFINYADFIIHHPVYKRLPIKQKKDGSYQFVTAKGSEIGQGRLKWIEEKARELGYPIQEGVYAKVMREIHPTKYTTCQICGRSLSIYYYYPNKNAIADIEKVFGKKYSIVDHISYIWDDLCNEGHSDIELGKYFFNKCDINENAENFSKDEIIEKLEYACRVDDKALLGPGAMSNAPDRFDGFHSYNRCCRKKEDRGRWDSNMDTYNQDRRAYERWSDGNIHAANKFMRHEVFKGTSADHIGPISLGFVHDPRYLQPMQGNRNSSKRDRLSLEDLDKIIEVEKRTGVYPASWYVKKVWEHIKDNYKAHPEKIETDYRDAMKQNMTNFMHLLYTIISYTGETGKDLLADFFLAPNYQYFEYDYEFNNLGEIINQTSRHRTERSKNDMERYKRVAINAVIEYVEKENRNLKPTISAQNMSLVKDIINQINNYSNPTLIKSKIIGVMDNIQDDIIKTIS